MVFGVEGWTHGPPISMLEGEDEQVRDHALALQDLPEVAHHDPFDRMLLAQCLVDGATLLTSDRALLALPGAPVSSARR